MEAERTLHPWQDINIINAKLLPKLLYQSSVLYTPPEIIKEFNSLVFHFLWNGKDKVTRRSTYAPYSLRPQND